ncbi:Uncharacterized protein TCM_021798 [Theobroma cacao]|uniref:Uncharacterized protein n=1 Tax=Theobroma cacao TaxID=3641 RepID=A0A061ERP3_THECC|nr:Uncharacterized protein TCM_021798 [Theobroma cacao]
MNFHKLPGMKHSLQGYQQQQNQDPRVVEAIPQLETPLLPHKTSPHLQEQFIQYHMAFTSNTEETRISFLHQPQANSELL